MQQLPRAYPGQSEYPDWHYQPIRLIKQEMENPLEVIKAFFDGYTLPQARKHCKEMLEDAMCNVEVYAINYLTLYDSIEKLIEAAWLLLQEEKKKESETINGDVNEPLPAILQLLITAIRPERIFLLSAKESADVDLLIVVPDNEGKPFAYYGALIEAASYGVNLSFSLHASSAFRQHREEAHPFWLSACTGNKQVYAAVNSPLPLPVPDKRDALAERMRTTFLTGMERSLSFLHAAQANRLEGKDTVTIFLLHQSAELLFRALIRVLCGTEVKEHSLSVLIKHLRRCAPEVGHSLCNGTEEEKVLLSLLDSAYRRGRYDDSFSPGQEQLNTLFKRIEGLHSVADKCFTVILRSLTQEEPAG